MKPKITQKILHIALILAILSPVPTLSQSIPTPETRPIIFPVFGQANFGRSFGDPRAGGRSHEGVDIFAPKGTPVVAAVEGSIRSVVWPQASWGYSVTIRDGDGYTYHYIHLNNDTPGTDDGLGQGMHAYAIGAERGAKVLKGQILGYVGDSGNAETTPPHLHFEIRKPNSRDPIDPYESLAAAERISTPAEPPLFDHEILPYGAGFTAGLSVAATGQGPNAENIFATAPMTGGGPHIKIYDEDKNPLFEFMAYAANFTGGVDVALADIDGDGITEIITAPGPGGGPHIRVFTMAGFELFGFMAYDANFSGGVRVAAADLDDDGVAEIITAPMAGGGPHIKIFNSNAEIVDEFMAYDSAFTGGVDVVAADASLNSTSTSGSIITSPGPGGGPHIKVFNIDGIEQAGFMAYSPEFFGGVKISTGNVEAGSAPEIITVPATNGGPHVRTFSLSGQSRSSGFAYEEWWLGGYDISVTENFSVIATGQGRRATVRLNPHDDLDSFGEFDEEDDSWQAWFEENEPE